ncbi:unnamed protein product [Larinioides sclopetarius]|uniref:BPTI/Kunitz inhibitor domain-containing protein n=1 Tax=Larinioides sclopetarius TaxID=280406 RepID=A0AAV1ZUB6_9ARAC
MAKLLCILFLAGFVFQAKAFSISAEPPNPDHDAETFNLIPSMFNPFDLVSNITSFLNPFNWVSNLPDFLNPAELLSKITSFFNPLNWIPDISTLLNPIEMMKKFVNLFNPFSWIPDFLNPFHHFPNLNPFKYLPNPFKYFPNPLDILGNDKCTIQPDKGPCDSREQRYFYDQNTNACLKFDYGGCKGNRNNFKRKDECERACRGH